MAAPFPGVVPWIEGQDWEDLNSRFNQDRRARRRPRAEVHGWSLRQPFPTVPIPLLGDDSDVMIDLQAVFTSTYDRTGYDYPLDYEATVEPPLDQTQTDWVLGVLRKNST